MNDVWSVVLVFSIVVVYMMYMVVGDIKEVRRKAPYGKVFVRDFMEMIDDIETATTHSNKKYIEAFITSDFKFKVKVEKELPYTGLEFVTIPMYKSYAVYIDDEIVCRAHIIRQLSKDHTFLEFSSNRKMEEVIDIVKKAHKVAREYNHDIVTKLFNKYDSKSFYSGDSNGNK